MKTTSLFVIAAVLIFGQSPDKKGPVTTKVDNWERSRQCAAQAEKVMAEFDRRYLSGEGLHSDGWTNHYSPKYNRCYVAAAYEDVDPSGARIAFPTYLIGVMPRRQSVVTCASL